MGLYSSTHNSTLGVPDYSYVTERGRFYPVVNEMYELQSLPTDPSGVTSVTFDGIVTGSEIHVYLPDGTEVAGVESCVADQGLTWPVYAPGSPNNTVTITLIKRGLRWQKFQYQSKPGPQVLPIFQNPDLGYSNPV